VVSEGISHGCESAETKKSSYFTFSLQFFADVAVGCGAHYIAAVAESPPMMTARERKRRYREINHRRGRQSNERRRICVSTNEIQVACLRCISIVSRAQQDQT
jgi:hypothetical protein